MEEEDGGNLQINLSALNVVVLPTVSRVRSSCHGLYAVPAGLGSEGRQGHGMLLVASVGNCRRTS